MTCVVFLSLLHPVTPSFNSRLFRKTLTLKLKKTACLNFIASRFFTQENKTKVTYIVTMWFERQTK